MTALKIKAKTNENYLKNVRSKKVNVKIKLRKKGRNLGFFGKSRIQSSPFLKYQTLTRATALLGYDHRRTEGPMRRKSQKLAVFLS
jgi:hypothetical protein